MTFKSGYLLGFCGSWNFKSKIPWSGASCLGWGWISWQLHCEILEVVPFTATRRAEEWGWGKQGKEEDDWEDTEGKRRGREIVRSHRQGVSLQAHPHFYHPVLTSQPSYHIINWSMGCSCHWLGQCPLNPVTFQSPISHHSVTWAVVGHLRFKPHYEVLTCNQRPQGLQILWGKLEAAIEHEAGRL